MPALAMKSYLRWKLDVHILPQEESASVYVFKCSKKPLTRLSSKKMNKDQMDASSMMPLPISIHEY